jgi:CheY-like chemotaxis protein
MESKGYTVLTAVNGLEAVDVYRQHKDKIDLVVSDIGLPLMDGIHEFEKLKEINPDVAIILASGFLQPSERLDLQKSGVKSVLQKPYLPDELLVTIRKVLDRK